MNITYISNSIIPSRSANSIQVMKMCQAFVKNGNKVLLLAKASEQKVEDIHVYYDVEKCFKIKFKKKNICKA